VRDRDSGSSYTPTRSSVSCPPPPVTIGAIDPPPDDGVRVPNPNAALETGQRSNHLSSGQTILVIEPMGL